MPRHPAAAGFLSLVSLLALASVVGCERVHLIQDPPPIPPSFADSSGNDWNAGRVNAIAVSPLDRKRAILAMEKGTPGSRAFEEAFRAWGQ